MAVTLGLVVLTLVVPKGFSVIYYNTIIHTVYFLEPKRRKVEENKVGVAH